MEVSIDQQRRMFLKEELWEAFFKGHKSARVLPNFHGMIVFPPDKTYRDLEKSIEVWTQEIKMRADEERKQEAAAAGEAAK